MVHCDIEGGDVYGKAVVAGWRGGGDWNSERSHGGGKCG